ncbi:hypothetical protein F2P81_025669 [Scophthalmus maximus]|uniref:TNFR-Cys domain-containing protein n=1 Tax=Scophthalmus maximus TaxID=52904 RepID=A0A6A4RPS8_SCOMX|nr:hypothetical protein F2P81_025669 [Scophthalmus maximus]
MRLQTPCTDSNDAICACNYNYFFNGISGRCEPCTVCPTGEGVYTHCDHDHDTVCEECVDDTFSDRESSLEPCLPCTICDEETEVQLGVCAPTYDSVCHTITALLLVTGDGTIRDLAGLRSFERGGPELGLRVESCRHLVPGHGGLRRLCTQIHVSCSKQEAASLADIPQTFWGVR